MQVVRAVTSRARRLLSSGKTHWLSPRQRISWENDRKLMDVTLILFPPGWCEFFTHSKKSKSKSSNVVPCKKQQTPPPPLHFLSWGHITPSAAVFDQQVGPLSTMTPLAPLRHRAHPRPAFVASSGSLNPPLLQLRKRPMVFNWSKRWTSSSSVVPLEKLPDMSPCLWGLARWREVTGLAGNRQED